jgi:hypothetical protein
MQKSLCQPRRLLLCMRLRGIIPFWRRMKLIQGQSLVGFIFPTVCGLLCCARNLSVPQGSSIVVIPTVSQRRFWPGAWSRGNEEERDVTIFVYGSSIQEARPFPPAVLVRSLFCYAPFCFQGCVKKFYFLICSSQLYGKKAGKTACRGLVYQQLPECLGN